MLYSLTLEFFFSLLQACSTWGPGGPHFTNVGYDLLHFYDDRNDLLGNRDGAATMSCIEAPVRMEVRRRR